MSPDRLRRSVLRRCDGASESCPGGSTSTTAWCGAGHRAHSRPHRHRGLALRASPITTRTTGHRSGHQRRMQAEWSLVSPPGEFRHHPAGDFGNNLCNGVICYALFSYTSSSPAASSTLSSRFAPRCRRNGPHQDPGQFFGRLPATGVCMSGDKFNSRVETSFTTPTGPRWKARHLTANRPS